MGAQHAQKNLRIRYNLKPTAANIRRTGAGNAAPCASSSDNHIKPGDAACRSGFLTITRTGSIASRKCVKPCATSGKAFCVATFTP